MSIEPEEQVRKPKPLPYLNYPPFPHNAGEVFREKEVKGKVIDDKPIARGVGTVNDNTLIGKQRSDIAKWEKSIEHLRLRIKDRQDQISAAKKKIKYYQKAAAINTTSKKS